jgi:hypothetical protein
MIGSGIFIVSADMARLINSPGWLLVAWGVTAALTILAAVSFVGAGLVAWRGRPERLTGVLMIGIGFALFAGTLVAANSSLPSRSACPEPGCGGGAGASRPRLS